MDELPARKEEVEHAQEEGIQFKLLNNPVEIIGYENPDDKKDPHNGDVTAIRCIKTVSYTHLDVYKRQE